MTDPILAVRDLTKRYGGLTAVNEVSFDVQEGEILSIIGPNGAGKSTIFKLISSFVTPTRGESLSRRGCLGARRACRGAQGRGAHLPGDDDLQGHDRARQRHRRPPSALAREPVRLLLGTAAARRDEDGVRPIGRRNPRLPRPRRGQERARQQPAAGPSARARHRHRLAANPKILLLDEPFAGMNHRRDRPGGRNRRGRCATAA